MQCRKRNPQNYRSQHNVFDIFDEIPQGIIHCKRRCDLLAADTEYITDDFDQAFGDFVPSLRCSAEDDVFYLEIRTRG